MPCKLISNTKRIMIKKANASKLKQSDYVYILQPKADHQGSKIPFRDFRWIGPYIIEKVLPNNKFLERKDGTNKTQILHRMRLRQFTPRQPIPDVQTTPREWQSDPEVIINNDDLYARAWECENGKPIFDSDRDNMVIPNSTEITVRSEKAADETRSTLGTTRESSPEIIPQVDNSYDGTDTYSDMQPDSDTSVEQFNPTPTNPAAQNMIYVITKAKLQWRLRILNRKSTLVCIWNNYGNKTWIWEKCYGTLPEPLHVLRQHSYNHFWNGIKLLAI